MKSSRTLLLLVSVACFFLVAEAVSQGGFRAICSKYEKDPSTEGKSCPKTYKPVCGNDGQTYQSLCEFCKVAMERKGKLGFKHEGKC